MQVHETGRHDRWGEGGERSNDPTSNKKKMYT